MRRLKFFLSNLLFRRNSSSIICMPYLGTSAYMFENQKDTDKLKKGLYGALQRLKDQRPPNDNVFFAKNKTANL